MPDGEIVGLIEITVGDARRCNRLRGGSVRDCSCRQEGRWLDCPPAAHLALLDPSVIRDCGLLLARPMPAAGSARPLLVTGELCREEGCGGFLVQTGTCRTCQSCGANDGCG